MSDVTRYLASLPDDRREALEAVRSVIRANLPEGYVESTGFGMITYEVPLSIYPDTYNEKPLMYAALASQKAHMAVYLSNVYADEALARALRDGFAKAKKKLDMGASCVRFKRLDDLPLDVIATMIAATSMQSFVDAAKRAHSKEAKAARRASRAKSPR